MYKLNAICNIKIPFKNLPNFFSFGREEGTMGGRTVPVCYPDSACPRRTPGVPGLCTVDRQRTGNRQKQAKQDTDLAPYNSQVH